MNVSIELIDCEREMSGGELPIQKVEPTQAVGKIISDLAGGCDRGIDHQNQGVFVHIAPKTQRCAAAKIHFIRNGAFLDRGLRGATEIGAASGGRDWLYGVVSFPQSDDDPPPITIVEWGLFALSLLMVVFVMAATML